MNIYYTLTAYSELYNGARFNPAVKYWSIADAVKHIQAKMGEAEFNVLLRRSSDFSSVLLSGVDGKIKVMRMTHPEIPLPAGLKETGLLPELSRASFLANVKYDEGLSAEEITAYLRQETVPELNRWLDYFDYRDELLNGMIDQIAHEVEALGLFTHVYKTRAKHHFHYLRELVAREDLHCKIHTARFRPLRA